MAADAAAGTKASLPHPRVDAAVARAAVDPIPSRQNSTRIPKVDAAAGTKASLPHPRVDAAVARAAVDPIPSRQNSTRIPKVDAAAGTTPLSRLRLRNPLPPVGADAVPAAVGRHSIQLPSQNIIAPSPRSQRLILVKGFPVFAG